MRPAKACLAALVVFCTPLCVGLILQSPIAEAGASRATSGSLYLGSPTNDLPGAYVPLGGFHRVPERLSLLSRPVVELIGTAVDSYTASVEWPIVKALDQFGSFSGLKPAAQICSHTVPTPVGSGVYFGNCGAPSFDFTRAAYRSSYLYFRPRMLVDTAGRLHANSLTAPERSVLSKYGVRLRAGSDPYKAISDAIYLAGSFRLGYYRLPLVSIGHYIEAHDRFVYPSNDFAVTPPFSKTETSTVYLPFVVAQKALANHRQPGKTPDWTYTGSLIPDVNTDANLMTALICRADGLKPKSVCRRRTITTILKHVR